MDNRYYLGVAMVFESIDFVRFRADLSLRINCFVGPSLKSLCRQEG